MGLYPYNQRLANRGLGSVAGAVIERVSVKRYSVSAAGAAAADTDAVKAAVTDTGSQQVITPNLHNPPSPRVLTATAGGTAADIKAITVTINGTDVYGNVQQEVLPAFTVNTAGTVTGSKRFKTVTSVVIPAHDGTGATTKIGWDGDDDGVLAAVTDTGSPQTITPNIVNPPAPRNVTATSGGTAGDIKAVQVIVDGTNMNDEPITETLPIFTADSATTVVGAKAFKTVTSITIPAHDGNGATTAIGFGDKLGLPDLLDENTVIAAYLGGVREGTAPTVVADADELEKNTVDLATALNGSAVVIVYAA